MLKRIRNLLTQPRAEWARIGAETESGWAVLGRWVLPLSLLGFAGTLLWFLLWTVIMGGYAGWQMAPFALRGAGLQLLAALGSVVLVGGIAAVYAPSFQGRRDWSAGCRVAGYASLPALLAGALAFLPFSWVLSLAGALWSVVLLAEGLSPVMKSTPARRIPYTLAVVLTSLLLFVLLALWPSCRRWVEVPLVPPDETVATAATTETHDTRKKAVGQSKDSARREQDEKATPGQIVIDQEAVARAKALLEESKKSRERRQMDEGIKQAVETAGKLAVTSVKSSRLAEMLPAKALGLERRTVQSNQSPVKGMDFAEAKAVYGGKPGEARIELEIGDRTTWVGGLTQLRKLVPDKNQETKTGYNRMRTEGDYYIQEVWDGGMRRGMCAVLIADRFVVRATVTGSDQPELAGKAVRLVDWSGLAALKDEATR